MSTQRGTVSKRKTKTGEVRYDARYRPSPQAQQVTKTFLRKGEAEQWLREQLHRLQTGEHVDRSRSETSFTEYAAQWVESRVESKSRATIDQDVAMLKHAVSEIGDLSVAQIDRATVQALLQKKQRELASSTVRHVRRVIICVLDFAMADRAVTRNEAKLTQPPKEKKTQHRVLRPDELSMLVSSAHEYLLDEYALLIETVAATGLRFSEALGLTTAALDADAATLRVFRQLDKRTLGLRHELKTDAAQRTISISDELAQKLSQHLTAKGARFDQDALMFTTQNGAAIRQSNFTRREWKPLVEALDLDDLTMHDLRHTHATLLAEAGVPVHVTKHRLGHSSPTTTLRYYQHASSEADAAAIKKLAALA